MSKKIIFLSIIALFAISFPSLGQNKTEIKISLDSTYLLMGKQTALHVEILQPSSNKDGFLALPIDTLTKEIEIAGLSQPDTIIGKSSDQRMEIKQNIIIQSFDSGLYIIPPIAYILASGDTVMSNAQTLKVVPANVDTLSTIHSFSPVAQGESRWWDFLPDFLIEFWIWIIVVLLILCAGLVSWLLFKKKFTVPFMPKPKQVSPYELAISSLIRLREEHLCENGLEKEYYTRLTDILRQYLEGRFNINAMEMTSSQILIALEKNDDISHHKDLIKRILEIADFVKFAKVRPLPDDNVAAFNRAKTFIEDTKPVVTEDEDDSKDKEEKS